MEQVAFISGGTYLYWSGIVIAIAAACAVLMAFAFRVWQGESLVSLAILVPAAAILSLFLGRILHWYCHYRQYAGLAAALTDFSGGAFSLAGAFLGVPLAVLLLRLFRVERHSGALLDAISPAAALGIAVGRLSAFFNSHDRGKLVFTEANRQGLPWSTALSTVSGEEWRAAVFFWEAAAALLLFLVMAVLFFTLRRKIRDGTLCLLFLSFYGAAEIALDSMRYDSSFLRICGFVSLVQILGGVSLTVALIVFSVRAVRRRGRVSAGCWICWALFLLGLGLIGFMEYYVQRHGDLYALCYSVMAGGLAMDAAIVCILCGRDGERQAPNPDNPAPAEAD